MGKGAKKAKRGQAESAPALLPVASLAFTLRRGLREFVVESGMKALGDLLEQERTELCGPRFKHEPERAALTNGELTLGGRRVQVRRLMLDKPLCHCRSKAGP